MVQYHSPERLRGGQLSPADDTWGLGALLFTALTGARPFGDERHEIDARLRAGPPLLSSYGVNDERLGYVLAQTLSLDRNHRIGHVGSLRQELERWYNDPSFTSRLAPLEDEESTEDDQAATAMVPVGEMMFDDSGNKNPDSRDLFAPPSFPQSTGPAGTQRGPAPAPPRSGPGMPPRSQPGAPPPAPPPPSPLGEQDATVMRALPAHIMAMAARAAAGSNPPPPPDPNDVDAEDTGGATRIAPAIDIQAVLQQSRIQAPAAPPSAPGSGPRPPPQRNIRSTQLGMGGPPPAPGSRPMGSPMAPPPPNAGPMLPRPGFAPPPQTVSSAPPPPTHTDDDVRTVMHDMTGPFAYAAHAARQAAGPQAPAAQPAAPSRAAAQPPPPAPDEDDDDDEGRTMMREAPGMGEPFGAPNASPAQMPPQQGWQPAAPPMQAGAPMQGRGAFGGVGHTDRPPGFPQGSGPQNSAQQGAAPPQGGVSALLQEALDSMPGQPGDAPPGFPAAAPFEPTGGFGGGPNLSPMGGSPQVAGPFQPLGLGGGQQQQQPFTPSSGMPNSGGGQSDPFGPGAFPDPSYGQAPNLEPSPPGGYPVGQAASQPQPHVEVKKSSKVGLFIVCLLVLVLAATLTFVALRFRAQLGF